MPTSILTETTEIAARYQDSIWLAEDFLVRRGITKDVADTFRLGYVHEPVVGHEQYQGYISIPYRAAFDGIEYPILTLRFRCAGDHEGSCSDNKHAKYMTLSGDHVRMFNIPAIIEDAGDSIHITEGEIDAIILNQCGYPAVGIPGAQAWRPYHKRMLAGFSNIYIWGDPDTAGKEMVTKITQSIPRARVVPLSKDVNDTYLEGGAKAIHDTFGGME